MLKRGGDRLGFDVSHIGTLTFDHERVSSTRIREALAGGDITLAEKLLGHRFFIMGHVIYGRQLGRQLGVPTANIRLNRYRAPLDGVFAVTVSGLERTYEGIANVGVRPTIGGKEPLLEVHLFDFAGDIYGRAADGDVQAQAARRAAVRVAGCTEGSDSADITEARDVVWEERMAKWLALAGVVWVLDRVTKGIVEQRAGVGAGSADVAGLQLGSPAQRRGGVQYSR